MADLVQTHADTIPILARGFLECRKYISPADVTRFLDEHLRARIGTRLIAEQHIALHLSSQPHCTTTTSNNAQTDDDSSSTSIGVIDTALRPASVIRHCESFVSEICELKYGVRPSVVITGQPDTRLAHVPTHLSYILTELLKNAFRATVENRKEQRSPIEVTIAASASTSPDPSFSPSSPLASESNHSDPSPSPSPDPDPDPTKLPNITIRIRDHGGGISPANLPNIWAYSFTTFGDDQILDLNSSSSSSNNNNGNMDALNAISGTAGSGSESSSSLAGLGYGLPLGRAYAEHFGGSIAVQSLWGWGTDVYLKLKGLGKIS